MNIETLRHISLFRQGLVDPHSDDEPSYFVVGTCDCGTHITVSRELEVDHVSIMDFLERGCQFCAPLRNNPPSI